MKRHQPNTALRLRATYGERRLLTLLDGVAIDDWQDCDGEPIPKTAARRAIRILEREFAVLGERRGR
jgi:hypothetical protein